MQHHTSNIGKVVILLFVVILFVILISWYHMNVILAGDLSRKTGTTVSIEKLSIGFKKLKIQGLKIGNPKGYEELPFAFTAEKVTFHAPLYQFLKRSIAIDTLEIENVYLGLIFNSIQGSEGNWSQIIENIRSTHGVSKILELEERRVTIENIYFKNISTDVVYKDNPTDIKQLPLIESLDFTDLSSEGRSLSDQIMNSVLGKMLESIFIKENLKNMIQNVVILPVKPLEYLLAPFTAIFGKKKIEEPPEQPEPLKKLEPVPPQPPEEEKAEESNAPHSS
jgi:hypothetical protein